MKYRLVASKDPVLLVVDEHNYLVNLVDDHTRKLFHHATAVFPGHDPEFDDVREFQQKFSQLSNYSPARLSRQKMLERIKFLQEELDELKLALLEDDLPLAADALIDLTYVAKGTGVMMGLPWAPLWDDVQRANMAKVPGVTHRGTLMDMKKPEGWVAPLTVDILKEHGWDGRVAETGRDDAIHDPQVRDTLTDDDRDWLGSV